MGRLPLEKELLGEHLSLANMLPIAPLSPPYSEKEQDCLLPSSLGREGGSEVWKEFLQR